VAVTLIPVPVIEVFDPGVEALLPSGDAAPPPPI
jgi:hypothetical protein